MTARPVTSEFQERRLRKARVLIIGGGAIGQVYGYHLQAGGAQVSFYLKPRYAAEAEEGFALHPYGLVGRRADRHFEGFDVYTRPSDIANLTFDQIWLCVSSPALRGRFVQDIAEVQPEAVWVSLQPGLDDRNYLLQTIPPDRLVTGMVGFVAYQAPLPEEDEDEFWPPGIAYWDPPASPSLFYGPEPFTTALVNTLQAGGLKAGVNPDVSTKARFGSAALMPFVIALEAQKWSVRELRSNPGYLELLATSIAENFDAIEKATGKSPGPLKALTKKFVWKLALYAAPTVTPFPFDPYFKYHFSKVRDQTEQMIEGFLEYCRNQGTDPVVLEELSRRWYERRPEIVKGPEAGVVTAPKLAIGTGAELAPVAFGEEVVHDTDQDTTPLPGSMLVADSEPTPLPGTVSTLAETTDSDVEVVPVVDGDEESDGDVSEIAAADGGDTEEAPSLDERLAETAPTADVLPVDASEAVTPVVEFEPLGELEADELPDVPAELGDGATEQAEIVEQSDPADELLDLPTEQVAARSESTTVPTIPAVARADDDAEVKFQEELPEDERGKLGRQDFIQTELDDSVGPADLADTMKSFGGLPDPTDGASDTDEPTEKSVPKKKPTGNLPDLKKRLAALKQKRQEQNSGDQD